MIVKLSDGFEVSIEEKHLNDWGVLKLLRNIDKGDLPLIIDVLEIFLGGEEEVDKLASHLEVDGTTSIDSMINAMREIMDSATELKNSAPSPA